jgi:hypothetical protein
MSDE